MLKEDASNVSLIVHNPPFKISNGDSFAGLIARIAPPRLPGYGSGGDLHFARGTDDGPRYLSPNILPTDPPWLRLAYMRHPMGREDLHAFLISLLPKGLANEPNFFTAPRPASPSLARVEEQVKWIQELRALEVLGGVAAEEETSAAFRRGWIEGKTLTQVWGKYQHLCKSVVWAWGAQAQEDLQLRYCQELAEEVARIFQQTHPMRAVIGYKIAMTGDNPLDNLQASLRTDRAAYQRYKQPRWQSGEELPSVARIAAGLAEVIGTAGEVLSCCQNCDRIFYRTRGGQKSCSEYCRTVYNRKKRTRGGQI